MQYVTGRSRMTQRRKRIATAFGIGAGGGAAAGLAGWGLKRGLVNYRRLRGKRPLVSGIATFGPARRRSKRPSFQALKAKSRTAPVGTRMGRMFGGMRRGLGKAARFASGIGRFVT